ncbi:PREDICTED: testis-specific serine/threonine-protein kinase 4-like, partial [Rhagoletis zephyria]|uniref:testis-specific serine/threonine-protein kinase 4-like n=1 Tax=Rhagoletis zephyria TaxID=28612 RepID=UPI000811A8BA
MASSSNDFAEIDSKTQAVFTKKGYQLQAKLGQGAFGQVYKAINVKRDNQVCAVKVMDTTKMSSKLVEKFLPRELAALMEVNHPYAVRVYDIFKMSKKVFIFMEFAGGGDLAGYVKKNKAIKEDLACYWFNQTSQAVDYLHTTHRMAHRDIKLDNILLNEVRQVKLSDFGFANFVLDESQDIYESVSTTFCGTLP